MKNFQGIKICLYLPFKYRNAYNCVKHLESLPDTSPQIFDWKRCQTLRGTQEKIVKNHLNIALLNAFWYLNGRYRHIFIPQKFFICSDFLAESLVRSSDAKIIGIKTYLFENFYQKKRLPKILGDLLTGAPNESIVQNHLNIAC